MFARMDMAHVRIKARPMVTAVGGGGEESLIGVIGACFHDYRVVVDGSGS